MSILFDKNFWLKFVWVGFFIVLMAPWDACLRAGYREVKNHLDLIKKKFSNQNDLTMILSVDNQKSDYTLFEQPTFVVKKTG